MRLTLAAAVFLTLAPAGAFAHGETTPVASVASEDAAIAEPAKAVDAFHSALATGDREGALALLDDNVRIFEQGWVERSKAEYASHHLASDAEYAGATTTKRTARSGTVSDDVAIVVSEGIVAGTFRGKAVDSVTLETMVLRRTQGAWRIVHIHWSSRAAQK